MKCPPIALLLAAVVLSARVADIPPGTGSLTPVEQQLRALEREVDAFYSGQEDFNKGVADLGSDHRMKKILCAALRDTVPKTLREFRADAAVLERQRPNMSEDQQARLSDCQSRLDKASPNLPACAGI